jgi:hypothetical protein
MSFPHLFFFLIILYCCFLKFLIQFHFQLFITVTAILALFIILRSTFRTKNHFTPPDYIMAIIKMKIGENRSLVRFFLFQHLIFGSSTPMTIMSPAISSTTRGASISCMFYNFWGQLVLQLLLWLVLIDLALTVVFSAWSGGMSFFWTRLGFPFHSIYSYTFSI